MSDDVPVTARDYHAHRIGIAVLDALEGRDLDIAFHVGAGIACSPEAVDAIMDGLRATWEDPNDP